MKLVHLAHLAHLAHFTHLAHLAHLAPFLGSRNWKYYENQIITNQLEKGALKNWALSEPKLKIQTTKVRIWKYECLPQTLVVDKSNT